MNSSVALFLACLIGAAGAADLGDRLVRTYTRYVDMPSTEADARADGWKPLTGDCEDGLGVRFLLNGVVDEDSPTALFFTPAGQASGVGVYVFDEMPPELVSQGYWIKTGDEQYFTSVAFRSASAACSSTQQSEYLGDRAVVAVDGAAKEIPLDEEANELDMYERGACFETMGFHYFYDLATAPSMSWQAKNLMPVVPMYNKGKLHAIFFASWAVQQSVFHGARWWEPVPLPNPLMCKNWCNDDCTFGDTWAFSTMHVFFHDPYEATCEGGCKIGCCPSDSKSKAWIAAPVIGGIAAAGAVAFFAFRRRSVNKSGLISHTEMKDSSYVAPPQKPQM